MTRAQCGRRFCFSFPEKESPVKPMRFSKQSEGLYIPHQEGTDCYELAEANSRVVFTSSIDVSGKLDEMGLPFKKYSIESGEMMFRLSMVGPGRFNQEIYPQLDGVKPMFPYVLLVGESIYTTEPIHEELPDVLYIVTLLGLKRGQSHFWKNVARALYSISDFKSFEWFSLRTGKNIDQIRETWVNASTDLKGVTMKTISAYAREDSPSQYDEWRCSNTRVSLANYLSGSDKDHNAMAKVLFDFFGADHMYSPSMKKWFFLKGNSYLTSTTEKNLHLKMEVESIFKPFCIKMCDDMFSKSQDPDVDEPSRETFSQIASSLKQLLPKLGNVTFMSKIMTASEMFFMVDGLEVLLNANENLIACSNCVIEVDGEIAWVREPKLEDYITMTTRAAFPLALNPRTDLNQLMEWFRKVYPDDDLSEYVFKSYASCLHGRNSEKSLYFCTGKNGNNSKSMIMKLLQMSFGSYCVDFPADVLCGVKRSGGPCPEIAQAKGAHIAIMSELASGNKLRGNDVKRYTGGDSFFARGLYENGGSITVMFRPFITCNDMPEVDVADEPLKRRFKIIPHQAQFINDPPEAIEEQYTTMTFKADEHFERHIPSMIGPFMWLLVTRYWPMYKKQGIQAPKIMIDAGMQHWEVSDIYLRFKKIKIRTLADSALRVCDAYDHFKSWYKTQFPDGRPPSMPVFKLALCHGGMLGSLSDETPGQESWRGFTMEGLP